MISARVCATFKDLSCNFLLLLGNNLCIVWLVGCMPELVTSRSAAAEADAMSLGMLMLTGMEEGMLMTVWEY